MELEGCARRSGRRMSAPRSSPTMTTAAMPLPELDRWLQERADRRPVAAGLAMLDGYVAAIVAGPVSISPPDWICPLLAVDADAFNHGDTPEFAAISAVALRHNDISNTLSTAPGRFQPFHRRKPNGNVDARPWCSGFYAAMRLRISDWACPLLGPVREGARESKFSAQRSRRYPSGCRGNTPILDADYARAS